MAKCCLWLGSKRDSCCSGYETGTVERNKGNLGQHNSKPIVKHNGKRYGIRARTRTGEQFQHLLDFVATIHLRQHSPRD